MKWNETKEAKKKKSKKKMSRLWTGPMVVVRGDPPFSILAADADDGAEKRTARRLPVVLIFAFLSLFFLLSLLLYYGVATSPKDIEKAGRKHILGDHILQ